MISAKLNDFFKKNYFLKDKIILFNLIIGLMLIVGLFILFYFNIYGKRNAQQQILLHYNIYFGIDWIGQWYEIFIYPLLGAAIFIGNLLLSIYFYNKEKFLSYLLIFSITFSEILIFIAGISVLWINF